MGRKKKLLTICITLLLALTVSVGTIAWWWIFAPQFYPHRTHYIYIDKDDTIDSVYNKVQEAECLHTIMGLRCLALYSGYADVIHTGRYAVNPGDNVYDVFNRLYRGQQTPTHLVIGSVRTMDRLARDVGRQLMIDSAEVVLAMADSSFVHGELGYDFTSLPCLFMADTYEVYWNISVKGFFRRMLKEHRIFWNNTRLAQAQDIGMTPEEVCILASIVEEETNNAAEKPVVAGLYINRLRKGMPLQADPTIRFALGNFEMRRITYADLHVDSPYNTYINTGLPPGPIRIPTPAGIDAVLGYVRHNYLYMCAKEDFSGTHNFASNYSDHLKNARKYRKALDERKIFR